jgi:L-alanine-DL-glutamate epimerase-like enolase superfamily enzyme
MSKPTDITIVEARCTFEKFPYRAPLKFGGRVVSDATLANVEVLVETRNKRQETGFGSMPVASVWAWPTNVVPTDRAEEAMKQFTQEVIDLATDYPDYGHPIDIAEQFTGEYEHLAKKLQQKMKLPEPMPYLAQLVAASPLDAALHDAYGRVNGQNSYNCLSSEYMNRDISEYLDSSFKGEYLDKYTRREPQPRMPLYHLVGAIDPLTPGDLEKKVGDGLPETLGDWINYNGLTHLKIKLNGDDLKWDVERVLAVDRVASETQAKRGCKTWYYSLDFNEKCANVDYVLGFIKQVKQGSPAAFDRVQYIEQPTHRDLKSHPENKMHEAAKLKPVVIDESLVDYDSLLLAREQGYSGIALKACKGQSESLLLGAAGQKLGMFLCVQDLTCPGFSFLHSASLAARIPGIAGIEGNSRQYCPAANRRWAARYPAMFDIKDGTVGTAVLSGVGLGF